jgi:hypothetical protein
VRGHWLLSADNSNQIKSIMPVHHDPRLMRASLVLGYESRKHSNSPPTRAGSFDFDELTFPITLQLLFVGEQRNGTPGRPLRFRGTHIAPTGVHGAVYIG